MSGARPILRRFASILICMILILHIIAVAGIVLDIPTNSEAEVGWSPEIRLSEWGNGSINPKITAWGNSIHVVWADNKTGNFEIYHRRSLDSGATWSHETRLSFTSENQTKPKIAIWENHVHVAWRNGYINSTDNGLTWGTPTNPFGDMDVGDLDIGVHQKKVYLAVDNHTFHYSAPPYPPMDEFWKYLLFKEISWPDWVILDSITDWWPYFMDIGMTVNNSDIHIVYGRGHHVFLDSINHTYSTAGGQPGSWSVPEEVAAGSTDELSGLSASLDGTKVRIAWCYNGGAPWDNGIYTRTWDGSWSSPIFIGGFSWGHTSVSGNYISCDYGQDLYSNEDGYFLTTSGSHGNEYWHDAAAENGSVHLVYIDDYEIYYMCKSDWPELEVSPTLNFNPPSPVYNGSLVTINATVSNKGSSANNVEVKFYNDNPDLDNDWVPDVSAEIIGNCTVDVIGGSSVTASIDWIPQTLGYVPIYVWVDPENLVIEMDDTNNLVMDIVEVILPPPRPPLNLTARLSPTNSMEVELMWKASPDDGSGGNGVDSYNIYRSIDGVKGSYSYYDWLPADKSSSYNWYDYGAGDGDWNDYFYIVRAANAYGEEKNLNKTGKVVYHITEGWNMVSVPLVQTNSSSGCVLQTLDTNYSAVQAYHAGKSRPWLHWHSNKPQHLNDAVEIDTERGYYIDMTSSDYLVVAGKVPTLTSIQLKAGWNLVGYPSLTPRTVNDALSSISGNYNKVEFYNTTTDKEEGLGPGDLMQPGYGYWIHCTADCVWEVPV